MSSVSLPCEPTSFFRSSWVTQVPFVIRSLNTTVKVNHQTILQALLAIAKSAHISKACIQPVGSGKRLTCLRTTTIHSGQMTNALCDLITHSATKAKFHSLSFSSKHLAQS